MAVLEFLAVLEFYCEHYSFDEQLLALTMPRCPAHIVLYFMFLLTEQINDDDLV